MKNSPFGYEIKNGKVTLVEAEVETVRQMFSSYLAGDSLATLGEKYNLKLTHTQIGRMLSNTTYTGDEHYVGIIDDDIFEKVQAEKLRRATALGRLNKAKPMKIKTAAKHFKMLRARKTCKTLYQQAEYLYGLIKIERT